MREGGRERYCYSVGAHRASPSKEKLIAKLATGSKPNVSWSSQILVVD